MCLPRLFFLRLDLLFNHNSSLIGGMFVSEKRCKGRYKKSTPEEECRNSTYSTKTLRFLYVFATCSAKILRLIIHSCSTKIVGSEVIFRLKIIEDDGSLGIRGILIDIDAADMLETVESATVVYFRSRLL